MNYIKDNHEAEEDRKEKWRNENRDALYEIEAIENMIEKYEIRIDLLKINIRNIKKQIGWQE